MRRTLCCLALLWGLPVCVAAQTLQQRVAAVGNGTVHLTYPARSGICGEGLDLFEEILR